jgi:uncharacterized protein (TIGR01244 family)
MGAERFRQVAEDFWVAPQLTAADFAAARALGIRTVINNRPDGEAPDQLSAAEAEAAARAAGLDYVFVPVPSGGLMPDHLAAFRRAVDRGRGPFLAYCRSGTRSCHLWAFSAARDRPPAEIVDAAAAAGYDLRATRLLLERIHVEAAGQAPR